MTLPPLCSPAMFHNLLAVRPCWVLHAKCGRTSELLWRTSVYRNINFMKPGNSCNERSSKKYMRNYNLGDTIQAYECDLHSVSSTEAQKLDKARRSAFKAWVHSLIGGTAFFADLVKHGLHDAEILHSLVSFIPIRTDNAFPTRTFWSKNHVVLHAPQQVTIPISNHRREISIRFTRTPVQTICFQRQYQLTPGKQAQMVSEKSENTWDEWISWDLL